MATGGAGRCRSVRFDRRAGRCSPPWGYPEDLRSGSPAQDAAIVAVPHLEPRSSVPTTALTHSIGSPGARSWAIWRTRTPRRAPAAARRHRLDDGQSPRRPPRRTSPASTRGAVAGFVAAGVAFGRRTDTSEFRRWRSASTSNTEPERPSTITRSRFTDACPGLAEQTDSDIPLRAAERQIERTS